MIRTLIVDDNTDFRAFLNQHLRTVPCIEVVGEAVDGREAIDTAMALRPDLCLLDVRMPKMNGFEVARRLGRELPAMAVIFITMYDTNGYRAAARDSGARGYVLKDALLEALDPMLHALAHEKSSGQVNDYAGGGCKGPEN